jgi:hypothetical protein
MESRVNKYLMAAAAAAAIALSAPASQAATTFNLIDQTVLNATGTENFGATIDGTGAFDHTFSFTTAGMNDVSGSVTTIRTRGGLKDLDFTSIVLDGLFAFTPASGVAGSEPNEAWSLLSAIVGAGAHTIRLQGNVVNTSAADAASYAGTLNLTSVAVPEPSTWALMILGFGGAGAVIRSRRQVVA